jgi:hypothetical protein
VLIVGLKGLGVEIGACTSHSSHSSHSSSCTDRVCFCLPAASPLTPGGSCVCASCVRVSFWLAGWLACSQEPGAGRRTIGDPPRRLPRRPLRPLRPGAPFPSPAALALLHRCSLAASPKAAAGTRACFDNCSSPISCSCCGGGGDVQCFLRESDVGRARAEACVGRLAELNSYVSVSLLSRPLNAQTVSSFSVPRHPPPPMRVVPVSATDVR